MRTVCLFLLLLVLGPAVRAAEVPAVHCPPPAAVVQMSAPGCMAPADMARHDCGSCPQCAGCLVPLLAPAALVSVPHAAVRMTVVVHTFHDHLAPPPIPPPRGPIA
ncbi:hypothetical protein ACTSKR_04370 [Chitinibacteraceae bacterium HSL-7]